MERLETWLSWRRWCTGPPSRTRKPPGPLGGRWGLGGWLVGLVGQGHMLRASEACRWAAMAFWRASRSNIGRP